MKGLFGVIIIEDEVKVASVNKRFVEKLDQFYVIDIIRTGNEAVKAVKELNPDVILLDIYLPELNGIQILKQIRQQEIPTDVIIISASNDTETIAEALRYGVTDYLIKPFSFDRFEAALNSFLEINNKMKVKSTLVQGDLDQMMFTKEEQGQEPLPKGLGHRTLNKLVNFLRQQEIPLTTQDISEKTGISRVTVRKYLEYLDRVGKVEVDLIYGTIGRPVHLFKVKK